MWKKHCHPLQVATLDLRQTENIHQSSFLHFDSSSILLCYHLLSEKLIPALRGLRSPFRIHINTHIINLAGREGDTRAGEGK